MKVSKIIKWGIGITLAVSGSASYAFWRKAVLRVGDPPGFAAWTSHKGTDWDRTLRVIREKMVWLRKQKTEPVNIQSFDGLKLCGTFLPAEVTSDKVVLMLHGFSGNGENSYAALGSFFHDQGYHVLLPDDRAHGASEGRYVGYGCLDREDCYKWVHYLHDRFNGKCSIYLHGTSMGATAVLMASSMNLPPTVKGIVAECGFTSPWAQLKWLMKEKYHIPVYPILPLASLINKLTAGYGFRDCDAGIQVSKTRLPVFLIHGDQDEFVPGHMAKKIYDSCTSRKQLWMVKGAGHRESYYVAQKEYEERVLDFLKSL